MKWTELILEHFVQIIHYIAWPAAVLIILLVFRKELRDLIGRFTEYQGRHGIFRFGKTSKPPSPQLQEDTEVPAELSKEAKKSWQHFGNVKRTTSKTISASGGVSESSLSRKDMEFSCSASLSFSS